MSLKNKEKIREKKLLFIDSLYNRQFQQNIKSILTGALIGGISSIILFRIKNRFLLCGISSAITCNFICRENNTPFFKYYFKLWNELKNDEIVVPEWEGEFAGFEDYSSFYNRYITYYYPDLC